MKRLLTLLLVTSLAQAGTATTEAPTLYDLLTEDNKAVSPRPTTEADCLARAKAVGTWSCIVRRKFTTVANCDGVAKPVIARELDADGYVVKPPMRGKPITETDWTTEVQDWVQAPAPTCWVLGWREVTQADFNEDIVEDGPPALVADTWSPALQALYDNETSVARRALP